MTSKKIITEMQNSVDDSLQPNDEKEKQIHDIKKNKIQQHNNYPITKTTESITEQSTISTTENKMIIILDGKSNNRNSKKENLTAQATRENAWPEFKDSSPSPSQSQNKEFPPGKTPYPWQNRAPPNKSGYQRNFGFAYHRVTGKPSPHMLSPDRTRNAYIAVSVIAPKENYDRKDKLLENELRQLKPWNHNQNLKNMANIRSNWVIQRDDNDGENRGDGKEKRG